MKKDYLQFPAALNFFELSTLFRIHMLASRNIKYLRFHNATQLRQALCFRIRKDLDPLSTDSTCLFEATKLLRTGQICEINLT